MNQSAADSPPALMNTGKLAQARKAIGESPLVTAKGLTSDLLSIHAVNLSALTKAIQQPGALLDEDGIPHKLILERISTLQKDIIAASSALLKFDEALASQSKEKSSSAQSNALSEGDKPTDISTIVLELNQQTPTEANHA